jgi:hypothetical protein
MSTLNFSGPPPLKTDGNAKLPIPNQIIKNFNKENIPINNSVPVVELSPTSDPKRIPPMVFPTSTTTSPTSETKIHGTSPTTSIPAKTPNHPLSPPELKKGIQVERVNWNKTPSPKMSIRSPPKNNNDISISVPITNVTTTTLPNIPDVKFKPIQVLVSESPRAAPSNIQNISIPKNIANNNIPVKQEKPNYNFMNDDEQRKWRQIFISKYMTIKQSYPNWNIPVPEESWSLDYTHDLYESLVKQIVISMNCNQYRAYLVIMFLGIEIFCIKVLGLDMSGYTLAQVESMNRYDQLLAELGEKYYIQGPSSWPLEARLIIVAGVNAIFFLVVKYLCKWAGNDSFAPAIQSILNQLLGGGNVPTQNIDEAGLPSLPQNNIPKANTNSGGFDIGSLLGTLGNLANGNGGGADLANNLAQFGTMFTKNMAGNATSTGSGSTSTSGNKPSRRPRWNN